MFMRLDRLPLIRILRAGDPSIEEFVLPGGSTTSEI